MEIVFENDHGRHKFTIGEEYDLDIVDEFGDVHPIYNTKPLGETRQSIQLATIDGSKIRITKRLMVFSQKSE